MKQNRLVFPAVVLSSILGITLTPGWSQTKSGGSSGSKGSASSQTDQGSSASSSEMKSSTTGSGAESSAKGSQGQWGKEDIKKVQEALKGKGQDPGAADGVIGAQTQKALRAFQSANGLKATGRLDAETVKALGVEGGSSSSMGSSGASSSTGSSTSPSGSSSMEKGSSSKGSSGSSATGSDSSSKNK